MRSLQLSVGLLMVQAAAHASVTLLLEEPFGNFGGMTPTGHAAIYLARVCAASPVELRRCNEDEQGVVISRYHRVSGYDWIAIPVLPYLYAVERPDQVPASVSPEDVAALRDRYRRMNLEEVAPDVDGETPKGDWIQLVGAAYDRTIYAFGIETSERQDDEFIQKFNAYRNERHFNILFHNCADFARQAVDFYYPHAIHRSFSEDMGIMTPKQAAKSLVSYSKHHGDLQFSSFVIPQVPGTVPRSTAVRGVIESFVKSKKYAVPLMTVAVLHPYFGGSMALAWLDGSQFNPRRAAEGLNPRTQPAAIASELKSNGLASDTAQ
ncbi:MAG TPA: hypothetical protein VKT81_23270 [Bryobacteraceae bacterium]|nr:hypothetical protein [Bryobacteraceae bacterium]